MKTYPCALPNQPIKHFLFLLLPALLLLSCTKKDLKPNITGTVSGTAYDVTNQEPYPNLVVTVSEYQNTSSFFHQGSAFIGIIGSGVTDANG
ncbi:MAG TPA: hypothetical protein VGM63_15645, partial [Mucilaginibacter sp.]